MKFKSLPDIASQKEQTSAPLGKAAESFSGLTWVGMEKIQMPILWEGQILSAEIKAQVNLKSGSSRGIHMSRLYSLLSESLTARALSWTQLESLAQAFIESQGGISDSAKLSVYFQLPLQRQALKSQLLGWRLYPVKMEVIKTSLPSASGKSTFSERQMTVEVLYSSTCPASTALSRELWRQDLKATFLEDEALTLQSLDSWFENQVGMPGTPHAQRSRAELKVEVTEAGFNFGPSELISGIEEVLQTPVQTVVKRIDEQEFARLNGQNTMFCEDAARKVQSWLESLPIVKRYHGTFEHQESLHPHNAVAIIEKS